MSLKLYYNFLSQPARALYMFLKTNNIPFEYKRIDLSKGEQYSPEFERVNPHRKIPAIDHNGFFLAESVGILRYLCREFKVDDHWYPKESKAQGKVDEYLEWQHLNTRLHCTTYFRIKYLIPLRTNKPAKAEKVAELEGAMVDCLDHIENVWLKGGKPYLVGDKISVADLLGASEIEQPRLAGFEPREGRPNITAWLNRVAREVSPYYQEAHADLNKVASNYG